MKKSSGWKGPLYANDVVSEMVGPGTDNKKQVKVWNRVITLDDEGAMYDAFPHVKQN